MGQERAENVRRPGGINGRWIIGGIGASVLALVGGATAAELISKHTPDIGNTIATTDHSSIELGPSSFTTVTSEEQSYLWHSTKTVNLDSKEFVLGFPVNKATLDKNPNIRIHSYFERRLIGGTEEQKDELEKAGLTNITQLSGFAKGTPVYYDYDSSKFDASIITIATYGENKGGFYPAYTTYRILIREKTTGKNFETPFSILHGKSLVASAPFPKDHRPVFEDGTPISPDRPISELTTDSQDWDGVGQVLPGEAGQIVIHDVGGGIDPNTSKGIILRSIFLQTSNGNIAIRKNPNQISMTFEKKDGSTVAASWETPK